MKRYEAMLEQCHMKRTKARLELLRILDQEHDFISAQVIHERLIKKLPNTPLSTIYRGLEALVGCGVVSAMNLEHKREILYELAHEHHAHHLICTECHKVFHVEECPVDLLEKELEKQYRFKVQSHSLEFYGLCEHCQ